MGHDNYDAADRAESPSRPFSRRRFLGQTGIAGAGVLGLATPGVAAPLVDDTTEIVVTEDERGPAGTEVVPQRWYSQAQRSRATIAGLRDRYGGKAWLGSVGRRANSEEIGGLSGFDIAVGARDVAAARRALPDQVDGFTVDVYQHEEPVPHSHFCTYETYSCVPGGAYVEVERNDGDIRAHSATGIAQTSSGYYRYMTCAHGFRKDCDSDIVGQELWQGSGENYVGYVTDFDATQDWALVRESYSSDVDGIDNHIVSATPSYAGWVTESGVDWLISSDETTYKYGARSCRTSGELIGEDWNSFCGGWVKWGHSTALGDGGDSGAPHYIYYESDGSWNVYLVGGHYGSGTRSWTDVALMPYAYRINDDHGITFGSSSSTC